MSNSYKNITTATTTVVHSGPCRLQAIVLNTPIANATVTIYDNTAASGTKVGTITSPASAPAQLSFTYQDGIELTTGLTIVTSDADDITVVYRPRGS